MLVFIFADCTGYHCTGGQEFQVCANPCGMCRDQQLPDSYCEGKCVAGCSCPHGQLLDDYGQCVKKEKCTCKDMYDPENPIKAAGEISKRGCVDW